MKRLSGLVNYLQLYFCFYKYKITLAGSVVQYRNGVTICIYHSNVSHRPSTSFVLRFAGVVLQKTRDGFTI
jgi:hypothetical protein